jgi:error-prone DNA polymerase
MIPLTVRSYYSLMWGTGSPQEICAAARQHGYTRLALTDTDNLYGMWPFITACRRSGIIPIIGAEITDPDSDTRAVCLVENIEGYRNLCRLITRRHCEKPFNLTRALHDLAPGLVILTVSEKLLTALHASGATVAAALPRAPSGHGLRLMKLARETGIPAVATPGSFFTEPGDFNVHRMLRAIDLNTSLSRLPVKKAAPPGAWLASAKEYARRFTIWPETVKATHRIAERLVFSGPNRSLVMPPWPESTGKTAADMLKTTAYDGARDRYGNDLAETVVERLEHELAVIERMGFSSYFLVVRDIVSLSPRICGRGSGAASLVAYCLKITNVCPIRHNLYFERFLNPGRTDPPDIDVDFAWDERDAVLETVLSKYRGQAAMVCNHVAFQPRMAIREVARVYGLTDREIGQISKRLPWFWHRLKSKNDLLEYMQTLPVFKDVDFPQPWPEIIAIAQQIIGIPRYLSVHPGGIVIVPDRIDNHVPVEKAPKGVPIIQWEKDAAEEAGLVKIDLLGNRSLGVIRDAIANLKQNGLRFDERRWDPENDVATQKAVAAGRTMGCFYIESPATRLLQQKAKVGDFEHLVIHSSIIRPAANEFIREYVRRLHGGSWEPIHPLLEDVLDETYGIMVYQEDVSRTAVALASFSAAEADGLRKIMSKKDPGRKLNDYKKQFVLGARAKGVTDRQIDAVWKMMMSFSGYSFCKPHSASYARVSFQAAYLKTHFPAEFMAAVISNRGGFYSTFAYVSEARRMGVNILPPDVNRSEIHWNGYGDAMRVGWLSVKHLGGKTMQRIIESRQEKPFRDIDDFLKRTRPDETEARALIHAGAFDTLRKGISRAELLWELACWIKFRQNPEKPRGLFDRAIPIKKPHLPDDCQKETLRREYAVLGFLSDRHPMVLFSDAVNRLGVVKARDLNSFSGRRVTMAGLLITGKVVHTKHGDPMEFLTFEDETGLVETTFFPDAHSRFCALLDRSRPFVLKGKVDEDFGAVTLTVDHVAPLAIGRQA